MVFLHKKKFNQESVLLSFTLKDKKNCNFDTFLVEKVTFQVSGHLPHHLSLINYHYGERRVRLFVS